MDMDSMGADEEAVSRSGRRHPFFRRSESTLCLGCPQPDPFALPLIEALPLADQPHLLQPAARREELFGAPRHPITVPSNNTTSASANPLEAHPTRLGLSSRSAEIGAASSASAQNSSEVVQDAPQNLSLKDSDPDIVEVGRTGPVSSVIVSPRRAAAQSVIVRNVRDAPSTSSSGPSQQQETSAASQSTKPSSGSGVSRSISSDLLLGRWRLTLDLFGRVFIDDVGTESGSIIAELGGFPVKEARFRRDMERLRNSQQRDLSLLKMDRDRALLITQTFKELNTLYYAHCKRVSATSPALAVSRVKVTFKDEPGEGSGVARSFYTAIAEALLSQEKLPNLDAALQGSGSKAAQSQTNVVSRRRKGFMELFHW